MRGREALPLSCFVRRARARLRLPPGLAASRIEALRDGDATAGLRARADALHELLRDGVARRRAAGPGRAAALHDLAKLLAVARSTTRAAIGGARSAGLGRVAGAVATRRAKPAV